MPSKETQIRDQQRETWDKFSAGWKKWDEFVMQWLAPVGQEHEREDRSTELYAKGAPFLLRGSRGGWIRSDRFWGLRHLG